MILSSFSLVVNFASSFSRAPLSSLVVGLGIVVFWGSPLDCLDIFTLPFLWFYACGFTIAGGLVAGRWLDTMLPSARTRAGACSKLREFSDRALPDRGFHEITVYLRAPYRHSEYALANNDASVIVDCLSATKVDPIIALRYE